MRGGGLGESERQTVDSMSNEQPRRATRGGGVPLARTFGQVALPVSINCANWRYITSLWFHPFHLHTYSGIFKDRERFPAFWALPEFSWSETEEWRAKLLSAFISDARSERYSCSKARTRLRWPVNTCDIRDLRLNSTPGIMLWLFLKHLHVLFCTLHFFV